VLLYTLRGAQNGHALLWRRTCRRRRRIKTARTGNVVPHDSTSAFRPGTEATRSYVPAHRAPCQSGRGPISRRQVGRPRLANATNFSLWRGPPGPRPTPSSALPYGLRAKSGSRGTRADQGVRPGSALGSAPQIMQRPSIRALLTLRAGWRRSYVASHFTALNNGVGLDSSGHTGRPCKSDPMVIRTVGAGSGPAKSNDDAR